MNARYHAAREAFLDTAHRWFMFGVIASGTTAIATIFAPVPVMLPILAALGALFGAADLAFDLTNRARIHSLMKRRYFELLADLQDDLKTVEQVEACTHRFSADEEPVFVTLLASSWNVAQEMIYGEDADAYQIPPSHLRSQNFRRRAGEKYLLKMRGAEPAAPAA